MEQGRREELRRLALWLSRRRAVDEALEQLTAYGPVACDRVNTHLQALNLLLAAERDAFAAVERHAPDVPQLPLPEPVPVSDDTGAAVVSLLSSRRRTDR